MNIFPPHSRWKISQTLDNEWGKFISKTKMNFLICFPENLSKSWDIGFSAAHTSSSCRLQSFRLFTLHVHCVYGEKADLKLTKLVFQAEEENFLFCMMWKCGVETWKITIITCALRNEWFMNPCDCKWKFHGAGGFPEEKFHKTISSGVYSSWNEAKE